MTTLDSNTTPPDSGVPGFEHHPVIPMATMGPAGTPTYRIVGRFTPCLGCFLCAGNGQLAFRPRLLSGPECQGYVIPASRPVLVRAQGETQPQRHLLPTPFSALIVPYHHTHNTSRGSRFSLGVSPNWVRHLEDLLPLVPGLRPSDDYSLHHQFGYHAGARPQGWEQNSDAWQFVKHGFTHVIYGRDVLGELSSAMQADELALRAAWSPLTTTSLGLSTIIHLSRVAAGSLPDDQTLWEIWEKVAGQPHDIEQYHAGVLAANGK